MSYFESIPRPTKTYHSETYDRIAKHNGFEGGGKTIVITGGAGGVGYSIAQAFAAAGVARIAIISRSPEQQAKAKADLEAAYPSTEILTYPASITDRTRMSSILQELGTVDVLVLNATIAHRRDKATAISTEEVQDAFDVNVIAAFHLTKAFLAMPLPSSGRKTVVNISAAAAQMPSPFRVGYGASKAAAVQIMQHFASEMQGGDVRIFSFHPGSFYTPGVAANIPKDMIQWEDINLPAHFTLWLAGPESDFLHGRYLWAHWDVDELIALKDKVANDENFLTIGLVQ